MILLAKRQARLLRHKYLLKMVPPNMRHHGGILETKKKEEEKGIKKIRENEKKGKNWEWKGNADCMWRFLQGRTKFMSSYKGPSFRCGLTDPVTLISNYRTLRLPFSLLHSFLFITRSSLAGGSQERWKTTFKINMCALSFSLSISPSLPLSFFLSSRPPSRSLSLSLCISLYQPLSLCIYIRGRGVWIPSDILTVSFAPDGRRFESCRNAYRYIYFFLTRSLEYSDR